MMKTKTSRRVRLHLAMAMRLPLSPAMARRLRVTLPLHQGLKAHQGLTVPRGSHHTFQGNHLTHLAQMEEALRMKALSLGCQVH